MRITRIGAMAFVLCGMGGLAQAAPPKPVNLLDRVATSRSRGSYSFRGTRYNKPSWGNRWSQTLGRSPLIVAPYVRGR